MSQAIHLQGMRFFGHHGVFTEEKEQGQLFIVDLTAGLPLAQPDTDQLAATVDYARIYATVRRIVEERRFDLLETLAACLVEELLFEFPLSWIRIEVKKPQVALGGAMEYAAVVDERAAGGLNADYSWRWAYLGLGSNLGDRQANLWQALGRMACHPLIRINRVSSLYQTTPWGGPPGQELFLNAVIGISTRLEPLQLLTFTQEVERDLGRRRQERWGPRPIDIDILLYQGTKIQTEELVIPHPRMWERDFVMVPLTEIAPDLTFAEGRTAEKIIREIERQGMATVLSKLLAHDRIVPQ